MDGPHVFILNGQEPQRRVYSKKGCRECKRRKIKCDEGKPSCWQCARLKKQCLYPKKGERVKRISLKKNLTIGEASIFAASGGIEASNLSLKQILQAGNNENLNPNSRQNSECSASSESTPGVVSDAPSNKPEDIPKLLSSRSAYSVNSEQEKLTSHSIHTHSPVNSPEKSYTPSLSITNGSSLDDRVHMVRQANSVSETLEHDQQSKVAFVASQSPQLIYSTSHRENDFQPADLTHNRDNLGKSPASIADFNLGTASPDGKIQLHTNPRVSLEHLLNASPNQSFPMSPFSFEIDPSDLNLLATDLNNIVADIVGEKGDIITNQIEGSDYLKLNDKENSLGNAKADKEMNQHPENDSTHPTNNINRSKFGRGTPFEAIGCGLPMSFINISRPHEKVYLEEFYNGYSEIMLPFAYWDPEKGKHINPVRDILLTVAERETYLLAAILAQGAYTSLRRSGLPEDERAHHHYLLKCLELLGPALSLSKNSKLNNHTNGEVLMIDIEAMLLTVLLLTSAHALNTKQDWRAHLRGARDLLLKLNNVEKAIMLPILVFCKFWFSLIEILAGLLLDYGGTLKKEDEMNILMCKGYDHEVAIMKKFKLINENDYNILYGYQYECVELLRDLIKFLNKLRDGSPPEVDEVTGLLAKFNKWRQCVEILKTGTLELNQYNTKYNEKGYLVDTFTTKGQKFQVCWPDLSHLAYNIAAEITLLTKGFGLLSDSAPVQQLVEKFTSMLRFLQLPEQPVVSCGVLMIQWPALSVGINCVKEEDRFLVMKLFRVLAQSGSGSARYLLRKLHQAWQGRSGDELDGVDILTY